MIGGGSVVTVVLLVVGVATLAITVAEGRVARSTHVAAGMALVVVGHVLRTADTLGWLPDVLSRGVDDEDAVATLVGLTALLVGGLIVLGPLTHVTDLRTHWALGIFALLVLVVLVVHVIATFAVED